MHMRASTVYFRLISMLHIKAYVYFFEKYIYCPLVDVAPLEPLDPEDFERYLRMP